MKFAAAPQANRKRFLLWGVLGLVVVLVLCIGGAFLLDPYGLRIAPGVTIGGMDVGELYPWTAVRRLNSAAKETLLSQELVISLPEETITVSPEEAGLKLSAFRAVEDAFRYGRREDAAGQHLGLLPYLSFDETALRERLEAYASRYDTGLVQPVWTLEGVRPELSTALWTDGAAGETLCLTLGTPECSLDVEGVLAAVGSCYDQGIGLVSQGAYQVVPDLTPQELPQVPDLDALYGEYRIDPVNDSLSMETYQPVPGTYGSHFDLEAAREMVAGAGYGETVRIPMVYFPPEILGEGVYFRDVLGSCETKHNDNENRNSNLRLLCKTLNGYIIQPGETFSYNLVLGERTAERGYKPAPAYSGNRLVMDYGGGVCQGSTTLYNCLLFADMEIVERHDHGATVTYIAMGLDAAVNWNTKTDLIFRNNSHFPVMIVAEVSDGYVRMQLLGTDEKDYYIKMETSSWDVGYARRADSYKCKYSKETGELISRELEARSIYYNIG